jgi:uncharacterized protein
MIRKLALATTMMVALTAPLLDAGNVWAQAAPSMTMPVPSSPSVLAPAVPAAPSAPVTPVAPLFPATHMQAAREVLQITGVTGNFDGIFAEFYTRMQQQFGVTRPELIKPLEEVLGIIKPEADQLIKAMSDRAAEFMAVRLNEADLKEVAVFFKSPLGKRYMDGRSQAMNDIFNALQPWSIQTSDFLFRRASEELSKRGHKL